MKMMSPSGKNEIDAHESQIESLKNAGYRPVEESAAEPAAITEPEPVEDSGEEISED